MLLRIGGEAAGHELAGPVIAADFLLGQCRRCALVGAIHDVPEFVQQREGQGKRDEEKHERKRLQRLAAPRTAAQMEATQRELSRMNSPGDAVSTRRA